MKQITAFIHRNRAADLVHALEAEGFDRLSLVGAKGLLAPLSARERDFSVEFGDDVISIIRIDLYCADAELARALDTVERVGRTGQAHSGWIYVTSVEASIEIGRGPAARGGA